MTQHITLNCRIYGYDQIMDLPLYLHLDAFLDVSFCVIGKCLTALSLYATIVKRLNKYSLHA